MPSVHSNSLFVNDVSIVIFRANNLIHLKSSKYAILGPYMKLTESIHQNRIESCIVLGKTTDLKKMQMG